MEAQIKELSNLLDHVRVPQPGDRVYKDECVVSFESPESPEGLYINLHSHFGFGSVEFARLYVEKTKHPLFLNITRTKTKIPESDEDGPEKKITKLAIGTPGGFMPDQQKYIYDDKYKVVVVKDDSFDVLEIPYPHNDFPEKIKLAVQAIIDFDSAFKQAEKESLAQTWDGEAIAITKHAANLLQLDNGKKIPPNGWKCEFAGGCDMNNNLWLNLTDGSILCGRKYYDGTGGNNHAIEHYNVTKYPLAVKLGTITKEGKADVYSYDEDELVENPNLIVHLAHWGINITQMEKTEKSMVELELDLNQKFGEWVALQESSSKLCPVFGPGYTGLINLGSSCYLNSVMQVIFTIPDFIKRFVDKRQEILRQNITSAPTNFDMQMSKLGDGLLSGKYSQEGKKEEQGIAPRMFKMLIGQGHPNFLSNRQQDAQEFFLHFINILERNSRHQGNPADCFKFKVEERYQCGVSKKVKYTYRPDYLLPLPIPMEAMTNEKEVEAYNNEKAQAEKLKQKFDKEIVRPRIKLESCLEAFARTENVEQFYSSALNSKTVANKTTRLSTFPDYLLIHLKKFTMNADWSPAKLDVAVEMPDIMDFSMLRGQGLQQNEELLPEIGGTGPPPPVYDEAILKQLQDMGFPIEGCKRALFFTQNQSIEAATNWIMEHIDDDNIWDQPFVPPGTDAGPTGGKSSFVPNEEAIETLKSMGFARDQAIKALKATENNLERAADWIFSHQAELDQMEVDEDGYRDGDNKYKLVGIISHMGTSSMVGHYVCHILKDDRWIIYNDEKVAYSENPPKELGYLYMYQRLSD